MSSIVENYVEVLADDVEESPEVAQKHLGNWKKYKTCKICGVKYPRTDMVRWRGSYYCHDFGCADDIRGKILNEGTNAIIKSNRPENDYGG